MEEPYAEDGEDAAGNGRKKVAMRSRKKRNERELQNFYRHQIKEEKREKLILLRKKFEDDKAKIAEMKLQRKFKPF